MFYCLFCFIICVIVCSAAPTQPTSPATMVCRIRRYRDLRSGFGVKERTVSFMPFLLKLSFKKVTDDDGECTYLILQATPFCSAFKSKSYYQLLHYFFKHFYKTSIFFRMYVHLFVTLYNLRARQIFT